jgi:hypothetical protein
MDLGTFLARKATTKLLVAKHERRVRLEHDLWAQDVKPHVTYYTAAPTSTWGELRGGDGLPVWSAFTFDKQIKFGLLAGQWQAARGNATSWQLWFQLGPLTTTKRPTAADYERAAVAAAVGEMTRDAAAVAAAVGWQDSWAQIARDYPASAQLLAA